MKRTIIKIMSVTLLVFLLLGCYGGMELSKKIYTWNGNLGDKYVNTAVMWAFFIIPVYEISGLVDVCVLNVLEFWTGSNPLAMGKDVTEKQIVYHNGEAYEITTSNNRLDVIRFSDKKKAGLVHTNGIWSIESNGKSAKIAQSGNENTMYLFSSNGNKFKVNVNTVTQKDLCLAH